MKILGMTSSMVGDVVVMVGGPCSGGCNVGGHVGWLLCAGGGGDGILGCVATYHSLPVFGGGMVDLCTGCVLL